MTAGIKAATERTCALHITGKRTRARERAIKMKEATKKHLREVIDKLYNPDFSANDADWIAHLIELAIEDEEK